MTDKYTVTDYWRNPERELVKFKIRSTLDSELQAVISISEKFLDEHTKQVPDGAEPVEFQLHSYWLHSTEAACDNCCCQPVCMTFFNLQSKFSDILEEDNLVKEDTAKSCKHFEHKRLDK